MSFAVVELSLGMVIKMGKNWDRMREFVETSSPSRWDNPVLVVVPDNFRPPHEEGEIPRGYVADNVVAVPHSNWGYGTNYEGLVNVNRKRFGLPADYEPVSPGGYGFMGEASKEEDREVELRRALGDEEVIEWTPEKLVPYIREQNKMRKILRETLG